MTKEQLTVGVHSLSQWIRILPFKKANQITGKFLRNPWPQIKLLGTLTMMCSYQLILRERMTLELHITNHEGHMWPWQISSTSMQALVTYDPDDRTERLCWIIFKRIIGAKKSKLFVTCMNSDVSGELVASGKSSIALVDRTCIGPLVHRGLARPRHTGGKWTSLSRRHFFSTMGVVIYDIDVPIRCQLKKPK
jgi:hypothetical protein